MYEPIVSIIVPAYKADDYIQEALSSIKNQSYTNWDLIIVEDGSEGKTKAIVDKFKCEVPNNEVLYIWSEHQGVAAARNRAINLAKGKYIAFMDADDIWLKDHLLFAIKSLDSDDCDLVYSNASAFDNLTNESLFEKGPSRRQLLHFPDSFFSAKGSYIAIQTVVMRRNITQHVDFDISLIRASDYDFFVRAINAGYRFKYLESVTCLLRRGHNSLVKDQLSMYFYDAFVHIKNRKCDTYKLNTRNWAIKNYSNKAADKALESGYFGKYFYFTFWALRVSFISNTKRFLQRTLEILT